MSSYNLRNIRTLLTEGFTETELRQFCYDTPEFRPVYDQLGETTGKAEIIHRLLEHADRKELLIPLLAWAKTQSQAKYEKYQPYQASPTGVGHGKLHNIPELPPHFLPRPTDLAEVKAALLSADQPIAITGVTRKVGLQGMGGIGKSVLAAALAHDDEVRQAFPGGIFWLTLGQEPALTTRQSQLAESLGDPPRIFNDIQQGRARLSELLAERACLLILDDVWQADHATAFAALGPQGRSLLTSRDAGLIRTLGAVEYQLNVLNEPQALELLAEWADQPVATLPAEAREAARECGYLPLALAMVGALTRGRPDRQSNLLHKLRQADLAKIRQQFPHYPYADLLRALQTSVEVLPPDTQARYLDLAVFPANTPIPEAALSTLWATEGLDEYDTQDLIDVFVDRSLARRHDQKHLMLHDLQYDYVRRQAGDLTVLHQRLVSAYRRKCPQGWTSGPDDGYFFEHLAYHLAEAGLREELYVLISKEWMDAQFKRTFSYHAFADDVERVIAVAGAEEPPNLVQIIRGCLIYTTLGGIATDVPPEIFGVLAQVGQVERTLDYAALMQDAEKRSEAYRQIGLALLARGEKRVARVALGQALVAAEALEDEWQKAQVLGEMAQLLAKVGMLERMLEMAEAIRDEEGKAWALSKITETLTQAGEFDRAMMVAAAIGVEWKKTRALSEIAEALAQVEVFDRAVAVAEMIENKNIKSSALYKVVQVLSEKKMFNQALVIIETIEDEGWKVSALCELAQALAGVGEKAWTIEIFDQALVTVELIQDEKVWALCEVAQALANVGENVRAIETFGRAMVLAEGFENEMVGIAQALAEIGEKARALETFDRVLTAVKVMDEEGWKASVISKMVKALAQIGEFDRAMVMAKLIRDGSDKASALGEVAQALARAGKFDQALLIVEAIEKEEAPTLGEAGQVVHILAQMGEFDQALRIVEVIKSEVTKWQALSEIATALVQRGNEERAVEVANRVLAVAEIIGTGWGMRSVLCEMTRALAQVGKEEKAVKVANRAVVMAEAIEDAWGQIFALSEAAQVLVEIGNKEQAAEIANRILVVIEEIDEYENWKISTLSKIAQTLAQAGNKQGGTEVVKRALAMAEAIEDKKDKGYALSRISQTLVEMGNKKRALKVANRMLMLAKDVEVKDIHDWLWIISTLNEIAQTLARAGDKERATYFAKQALAMTEAVKNDELDAFTLSDVAESLVQVGEFDHALAIMDAIEDKQEKAYIFSEVVQALIRGREFDQVLTVSDAIGIEKVKAPVLGEIAHALAWKGQLAQVQQILCMAFITARLSGRSNAFETLQRSTMALAALDQGETLWRVYEAVMEVEGWWGVERMKAEG